MNENTPLEGREDMWQDIGDRGPATPLTPDQASALAAQGLGGQRLVRREQDRQGDIARGIGTNEPPLTPDAQARAHQRSIDIRRIQLQQRRDAVMQLPEGSERTYELAKIRVAEERLEQGA